MTVAEAKERRPPAGNWQAAASGMERTDTPILPRATAPDNALSGIQPELYPNGAECAQHVPHNGAVKTSGGEASGGNVPLNGKPHDTLTALFRLVESHPGGTLVNAETFKVVACASLMGPAVERAITSLEEEGIAFSQFVDRFIVLWPTPRSGAAKVVTKLAQEGGAA